jgi:predicted dehydrogenase
MGIANYHARAFAFLLLGSEGRIEIAGDAPPDGQPLLRVVAGGRADVVDVDTGWHRGLSPQVDMLNALEDGHVHPLNGESARADLEVLLAVYESARLGRLVVMPLENSSNPLEQLLAERRRG